MTTQNTSTLNKPYVISVSLLTFVLPVAAAFIQKKTGQNVDFSFEQFGKWFIFSAVGLRLFVAGIKQVTDPAFTAKQIFHIKDEESLPIVRELGFANLCFGAIGIASLFIPQWRIVSAFGSGLYYGMAAFQHLFKKPAGANEKFALLTDIMIFVFLLFYFMIAIRQPV